MPVLIAPQYTQRILQWADWKIEQEKRLGIHQVVEDPDLYTVWFYDIPDVFVTYIHRGPIPDTDLALGRTQEDNDSAKIEFEADYLSFSNSTLNLRASSNHVTGVAAAKGLGGYLPNPSNTPYQPASEELVSLYVDGEGSLVSRGSVLTDEGSFRNDFTGDSLEVTLSGIATFTSGSQYIIGSGSLFLEEVEKTAYVKSENSDIWCKVARIINDTKIQLIEPFSGQTVSGSLVQSDVVSFSWGASTGNLVVSSSKIEISSSVSGSSGIGFYREADYGPMKLTGWFSINNRQNGQRVWFGFHDDPLPISASYGAFCEFTGSGSQSGSFVTSFHGEEERTSFSFSGSSSDIQSKYTIFVAPEFCTLYLNDVQVAKHELHIPGPYDEMTLSAGIETLEESPESTLSLDCLLFQNFNLIATKAY